jgi:pimeloyl-ACP methyl ester carboxylesterase
MALRLESLQPGSFAGLVLMEPPATPPAGHPLHAAFDQGRMALATRAGRRQERFASVAELASKFTGRAPFARFEAGAAEELAAAMLVADDGGFRLACPPAAEARYFETNVDDGVRDRLDAVACPALMLVGGDDLAAGAGPATVGTEIAHEGGFDLVELAGTTHMMPLERPRAIAELTRAFVATARD